VSANTPRQTAEPDKVYNNLRGGKVANSKCQL